MADRIEQVAYKSELDDGDQAFVGAADMLFLATIDGRGRPTVSYKGGDPGFVRVLNNTTLIFPSYDGNGMFLSMGNISANAQVGMLFISFERPHRLRVQGTATISRDDPERATYPEADLIVRVNVTDVWKNCPRYVHRYEKVGASRYVPRESCETPLAEWKRVDLVQDVLPERDRDKAQRAGLISAEEWLGKVQSGDPTA
jgi:uncharacterized protein